MIFLLLFYFFFLVLFTNVCCLLFALRVQDVKLIEIKNHISMRFHIFSGVHLCIWCSLIDQYLSVRFVSADKG